MAMENRNPLSEVEALIVLLNRSWRIYDIAEKLLYPPGKDKAACDYMDVVERLWEEYHISDMQLLYDRDKLLFALPDKLREMLRTGQLPEPPQ